MYFLIRTSIEPIPNLKQYFYDYKTINSLGLFSSFHLLRSSAKALFPANAEFVLTLTDHFSLQGYQLSCLKHK